MTSSSDAIDSNRTLWDQWAPIHAGSDWYDLAAVKAGKEKLRAYEHEDVGEVSGLSMLHLQCHLGTDSVAWARRGARVTGVDFSSVSVGIAEGLARESGVDATFVCSDVMQLPASLDGAYDIVYASRGILGWVPDLPAWARVISHFLVPGGFLYLTDIHPVAKAVDDTSSEFRVGRPYWHRAEAIRHEVRGSYADPDAQVESAKFLWTHSTGDLLTAVAQAGLCLELFREFPWLDRPWPSLRKHSDREFYPPDGVELPLFFSLRARKL
ncbi:class I SAM-dependent methyltransferase [Nocardia brasiliensis]|uniref:class I SAM-dependent methyltransferase n=1 Tax=Nocardia brasiliensis TaxID=37326 RepID=UPI003D8F5DB3